MAKPLVAALLALMSLTPSVPLRAQSDTTQILIAGTILDPLRKPIEGVEVRIPGTGSSVLSSPAGTFRLRVPKAAVVLFQLRRPGYNSQLLKTSGDWSGTVIMEPGAFELPEVQVTARYAKPAKYAGTAKYDDYFRRRRQGLGEFIDREEIDRRFAAQTAELVQGRPGVKVTISPSGMADGTVVMFARCNGVPPKINVYVDGRKLQPEMDRAKEVQQPTGGGRGYTGDDDQLIERALRARSIVGEMLSRINPGDIEMIEIFRGPSELPPEFNDGNCGAIAIWTRSGGS